MSDISINDELTLVQKYKPKTLAELKLPVRIANILLECEKRQGYRLLLHGWAGTGKTSTALLLNSNRKKFEVLYLSGSNDFNVQTLREKVYPFAGNHSVLGLQKTVIIDEAENIQMKTQQAFKIILDSAKNVNFIFITNHIEKMDDAVLSRCTQISYDYNTAESNEQANLYVGFLQHIATQEKIPFENRGLKELYLKNFPDYRHSLVTMQQLKDSKLSITEQNVKISVETISQDLILYEFLTGNLEPQLFFEKCTTYKGRERDSISSLSEPFFLYLNSLGKFDETLKGAIIVSKYSNMMETSFNKFGTFFACMVELKSLFR
jgi:DNA polymerase III gamma/tau subunit